MHIAGNVRNIPSLPPADVTQSHRDLVVVLWRMKMYFLLANVWNYPWKYQIIIYIVYLYSYIYIYVYSCVYIYFLTQYVYSTSLCLGGFGAGRGVPSALWTCMVPGFTTPAGFVTAAQAVHVISPLETVSKFREGKQGSCIAKLPFRKGKPN